ncbi:hypothetical protein GEMRC1_002433 [Eukaryota sp. GEM-RC1]
MSLHKRRPPTSTRSSSRSSSRPKSKSGHVTTTTGSYSTRRRPQTSKPQTSKSSRPKSSRPKSSRPSTASLTSLPSSLSPLQEAASIIRKCDYVCILSGAGMSADSALPTYQDIAKVPAYQRLRLEYDDLCDPSLLRSDPDLFYGFWGSCYNSYKSTSPHLGYDILRKWTRRFFRDFFVMTSNVDELFPRSGFPDDRLVQCHGSCFLFQCQLPCRSSVFSLDDSFVFNIDPKSKRLQRLEPTPRPPSSTKQPPPPQTPIRAASPSFSFTRSSTIPNSRCMQRPQTFFPSFSISALKPPAPPPPQKPVHSLLPPAPVKPALPLCPSCFRSARPNVLMWNDESWIEKPYADEGRLANWLKSLPSDSKVCVLELGAGLRVPTIREEGASVFKKFKNSYYIRVNIDHQMSRFKKRHSRCLSLTGSCESIIKEIDQILEI